jgi:hypothetical protein
MMNIQEPSQVVFNGTSVHLDQLDLRTIQFLVPQFPRLNGQIAGRATLDSSWLDVRFRGADLTHSDGTGPATRMIGAGRVTFGETTTTYDIAMNAQPFSFTTFGRAYTETHVPLKGEYTDRCGCRERRRISWSPPNCADQPGCSHTTVVLDGDSIGGYALNGVFSFSDLDLRTLLDTAVTPVTALTGLGDAQRARRFAVQPGGIGGPRPGTIANRFAPGARWCEDATPFRGRPDDGLRFRYGGDCLGTTHRVRRPWARRDRAGFDDDRLPDRLARRIAPLSARGSTGFAEWSIQGTLVLRGSVDTLDVGGVVTGQDIVYPGLRAQELRLTPALTNVSHKVGGQVSLHADTLSVSGVRFSRIDGDLGLGDGRGGAYSVLATEMNGPVIASVGAVSFVEDTATVRMDSLSILLENKRYTLERPASIRVEPTTILVDTVALTAGDDQRMLLAAVLPDSLPITLRLALEKIPLRDFSTIAQTRIPLGGDLSATLEMTGTRELPRMTTAATLNSVTAGDVKVAQVAVNANYENRRLIAIGRVVQSDTTVLTVTANYPVDLALVPRNDRILDDTMRVRVTSPEVALDILESFTTKVRNALGTFKVDAELAGKPGTATLNGGLMITRGQLTLPDVGITLREINTDLRARNDTLIIDTLTMVSGPQLSDRLTATGPRDSTIQRRQCRDRPHVADRPLPRHWKQERGRLDHHIAR